MEKSPDVSGLYIKTLNYFFSFSILAIVPKSMDWLLFAIALTICSSFCFEIGLFAICATRFTMLRTVCSSLKLAFCTEFASSKISFILTPVFFSIFLNILLSILHDLLYLYFIVCIMCLDGDLTSHKKVKYE